MSAADAAKVRAAAEYIDRVGLHKGDLFDYERAGLLSPSYEALTSHVVTGKDVPCCTVGALIAFGDGDEDFAWDIAGRVTPGAIGPWNDKPSRTKEEVVARLRRVADELEQQE